MANKLTSMPGQFLSLLLVVWVLSAAASGNFYNTYGRGNLPSGCGDGRSFFKDFMKCDASIPYCFEYRNESCLGPDNWVCVHNLNRAADEETAETESDGDFMDVGFGNTRCCGGKYQSPINIPTDAECHTGLRTRTPFYPNPDQVLTGVFENTGYYPKFFVEAENDKTPLIAKNFPFTCSVYEDDEYVFSNIHIHSGIQSKHGSAHFVGGKSYDGEFHIVHVHKSFHDSETGSVDMRCASQTPLGLAVIGVFLSLDEGETNEELNKLLDHSNLVAIEKSHFQCDFDEMCDPDLDELDDKDGDSDGYLGLSKFFKFRDDDDYCEDVDSSEEKDDYDDDYMWDDDELWGDDFDFDRKKRDTRRTSRRRTSSSRRRTSSSRRRDGGGRERERERERERKRDGRKEGERKKDGERERGRERERDDRRDGERERDGESEKERDSDSDNDSNEMGDGNRRKVECFCRRRRLDEIMARWHGAGHGKDAKCRTEDHEHHECNQHTNGAPCGDGIVKDFELSPGLLLPKSKEFYQYFGSLTTPPCSEVVNWIMMKEPIRITQAQLDNLHLLESRREDVLISKYGDVRPWQPINGRPVLSTC